MQDLRPRGRRARALQRVLAWAPALCAAAILARVDGVREVGEVGLMRRGRPETIPSVQGGTTSAPGTRPDAKRRRVSVKHGKPKDKGKGSERRRTEKGRVESKVAQDDKAPSPAHWKSAGHDPKAAPSPVSGEVKNPKLTGKPFTCIVPALSNETLRAVNELGFSEMAPVQEATIPLLLSHKDAVVHAPTGPGKTLAFLLPVHEILLQAAAAGEVLSSQTIGASSPICAGDSGNGAGGSGATTGGDVETGGGLRQWPTRAVGAVVVAPTRELASQISVIGGVFARHSRLRQHSLIGGTDDSAGLRELQEKGGNIIIATPGRLVESLFARNRTALAVSAAQSLRLNQLRMLILDEADRLLDMGFKTSLNVILRALPKQRRTGLFSATMTTSVVDLVRAGLRNPRRVTVHAQTVERGAEAGGTGHGTWGDEHLWMCVDVRDKLNQLVHFLNEATRLHAPCKAMVFVATCWRVDYLARALPKLPACQALEILGLHGKMEQKKRDKALRSFTAARSAVLLCTDVAARGLDIPAVSWVVQLDAPQDPDFYLHRVGRTRRMGSKGQSLLFLAPHEREYIDVLVDRGAGGAGGKPLVLQELALAPQVSNLFDALRDNALKDRDLYERGLRAYVSIVRAYREHLCDFIFRLNCFDFAGMATALGLLQLPYMKELVNAGAKARRGVLTLDGFLSYEGDVAAITFADPVREKARQLRLTREAAEKISGDARKATNRHKSLLAGRSWSKKIEKMERREKRKQRKEAPIVAPVIEDDEISEAEEEQLRKEMALIKKLRQRRITPEQFETQIPDPLESNEGTRM